jgi:hypothetical protein
MFWVVLVLAGCAPYPNDFAPTRERKPDVWGSARGLDSGFRMSEAGAERHFLHGVDAARFDGVYRQVAARAAFRLAPGQGRQVRLEYQSALPQSITVKVNGVKLGSFAAESNGTWTATVPEQSLVAGVAALVELESEGGFGVARLALE